MDDWGIGLLLKTRQIKKMISSYVGENETFERQYLDGELEVELVPQGTLAERVRAGGAGIGGFYTPTGVGTMVAEGKETRVISTAANTCSRMPIRGDFAFVKAWKGDQTGNLVYRSTTRNFNPMAATAGNVTLAEVEHLVPVGGIEPDQVVTPGIYVDCILPGRRLRTQANRKENESSGGRRSS